MPDIASKPAPLSELLKQSAEQFDISTEITNPDVLLAGESSRHFPEPRDRRKADAEDADILRLKAILEALDKGAAYPAEALEHANAPVHSEFYKQF